MSKVDQNFKNIVATNSVSAYSPTPVSSNAGSEDSLARSFVEVLNSSLGIKPAAYKRLKGFDKDTQDIFKDFMAGNISASKIYVVQNYLRELKDAEEFEKAIRKLISEARNNSKAAQEALAILLNIKEKLEKEDDSPEEFMAMLKSGLDDLSARLKSLPSKEQDIDFIKAVDHLNQEIKSDKYLDTKGLTVNELFGKFAEALNKEKSENEEIEKIFNKIVSTRAKKAKKVNTEDKSTHTHLEEMKKLEEFDQKIRDIMSLASSYKKQGTNESVSKLIDEMVNTNVKFSNFHSTRISRLDNYLHSPVFA